MTNEWMHSWVNDNVGGYYYHYNFFDDNGANTWYSASRLLDARDDWNRMYNSVFNNYLAPKTIRDYEPDEFSFSFLGYSGSFYLDEKGHWKVRSDQRLKVEVSSTIASCQNPILPNGQIATVLLSNPGFSQFTITDNKGIKYVFGGDNSSIEYSNTLFTQDQVSYIPKTWNLTKIILANQEKIRFNYERGKMLMAVQPATFERKYGGISGAGITMSGSLIIPSYLSSISTNLQKMVFHRSESTELGHNSNSFNFEYILLVQRIANLSAAQNNASQQYPSTVAYIDWLINWTLLGELDNAGGASAVRWSKLDSIDVIDNTNTARDRYVFQYNNNANERLKLLGMIKKSPLSNQTGGQYIFGYDVSHVLPAYLSAQTDYWNYYNAHPLDLSSGTNFNASRQPNPVCATADILNKITYPTGGYTTYAFEPHIYSKQVAQPRNQALILP